MNRSVLTYIIFGLAVIGLISYLINQPVRLLNNLLIGLVLAVAVFMIIRSLWKQPASSHAKDEMRKYRRAVKQSRKKYGDKKTGQIYKQNRKPLKKRRQVHLTLIKGNKDQDSKDRASN